MSPRPPSITLAQLGALCGLIFFPLLSFAQETAQALFNGKDLSGWVIENGGRFSVADGVIKLDRGTGWLRSVDTFADYTLVVEARFMEANANSGIFVRTGPTSHADEKGYPNNGYQIQCMDITSGDHPIGTLIDYGAGSFEQVFDREIIAAALHPPAEWNRLEITCIGEHVSVRLNGTLIMMSQGVQKRSGYLGLQGENGPLEFRKIEITEHRL